MALTNNEIVKTLQNCMTKSEYQAFLRSMEKLSELILSGGYYQKPNDGIPKKDLSLDVQEKLNEVDQCYKPGVVMAKKDLPQGVASSEELVKATQGMVYKDFRANRIIDEIYEARESTVANPISSLKNNLNTHYSRKDEIISNVNGSGESGSIAKSHIQPPDHSELTGNDAEGAHPMIAIVGLNAALSEKVNIIEIIQTINNSAEPVLIALEKVNMGSFEHNTIGGRNVENCHPKSAIIGLVGDLTTINETLTSLEGLAGDNAGSISTLEGNDNCLAQAVAQLFNNAGLPVPACVQGLM